jgi:hypothetical protein
MGIQYRIDNLLNQRAPLYYQSTAGHGLAEPKKAYLILVPNGCVYADWVPSDQDSGSSRLRNGVNLRWPLSPYADGQSLYDFLRSDRMRSLLERVHEGHSIEWSGGDFEGKLTKDAQDASAEIVSVLNEKPYRERGLRHAEDFLRSRFSPNDVVEAGNIHAYIEKMQENAAQIEERECVVFFGNWGSEIQRLCLDHIESVMKQNHGPDETARKLAQMLAEHDPKNGEWIQEAFQPHIDDALPFNQDGQVRSEGRNRFEQTFDRVSREDLVESRSASSEDAQEGV